MTRNSFLLALSLFTATGASAETGSDGKAIWPVRVAKSLMAFIDTMAASGRDRNFIEVPKRPWQVMVRGNINQSDLKLNSVVDGGSMFANVVGNLQWEPRIKTVPSTYVGVWAGYRGYGLGYSWNVGGDNGSILTFGAMGGSYGINLRIHNFENDEPEVYYAGHFKDEIYTPDNQAVFVSTTDKELLLSPIRTRTLLLDGYYLFNGKHFSYAAAYDQSVIQRRSAGSLMAGAMYYHSHINYATDDNADFILLMDNIGKIKQWQASAGVGYAYNLVPCKGLLVNAMAMPMLTFYNRHKTWRYDSNYRDLALDDDLHDDDELSPSLWKLKEEPLSVNDSHSNVTLNIDTRLSLTYNWKRFFLNAYGQFSNFHYKDGDVSGRLNDWYINASLGVRF